MAAALEDFNVPLFFDQKPLTMLAGLAEQVDDREPSTKRGRYEWSDQSGSTSPVDENHAHADEEATQCSSASDESENKQLAQAPAASAVPRNILEAIQQNNQAGALSIDVDDNHGIFMDAKFPSYAAFEACFDAWKTAQHHPFRVASSETLREPDGSTNLQFKYRYIVFHCAHYGQPRMRGAGKRPNQNYLPCGCKAMLRVNYNFNEKVLKITTLNPLHSGHGIDSGKQATPRSRKSTDGASPAASPAGRARRVKQEGEASPLASPAFNPALAPTGPQYGNAVLQALQQQQQIAAYLQQHQLAQSNLHTLQKLMQNQPEFPPPASDLPRPTPVAASPNAGTNTIFMNMLRQKLFEQATTAPLPADVARYSLADQIALDVPPQLEAHTSQEEAVGEKAECGSKAGPMSPLEAPLPCVSAALPAPSALPVDMVAQVQAQLADGARSELPGVMTALTDIIALSPNDKLLARVATLKNLVASWQSGN